MARYWRLDTFRLRPYPAREFKVMAEAMTRMVREQNEAVERARYGGLGPQKPPKGKKSAKDDW